ncbi:TRHR (predicted) [Pycnogonum litorale]
MNVSSVIDSVNGTQEIPINCSDPSTFGQSSKCNESIYKDLDYYSPTYRIVGTLFLTPILIVGVIGNVMVVTVVARTRSMRTPTNCYLVSLAFADILVLITSIPNEIVAYYLLADQWIYGKVGCLIFVYLQYLGINASALSITAFTIERYIAICHPMRAHTMCTLKRAVRIIGGVWVFGTIYCAPWLFVVGDKPIYYKGYRNLETCDYIFARDVYLAIFLADIIIFYVIPLILCVVLYGMIINMLLFSDMQANLGKKNNGLCHTESKKCTTGTNPKIQVIKMLVVVVAIFATLWMPYRMLVVYNSLASSRYMNLWFLMFCKTMIYINSAVNPVLYNAMSIKFRRAFKRMLSCENGSPTCRRPGTRFETSFTNVEQNPVCDKSSKQGKEDTYYK